MLKPNRILLGVNVDNVATLRQARGTRYPDPVYAAAISEEAGADGITIHLREDRRHIQERDVRIMAQTLNTRMNLEMAVTEEMIALAEEIAPPCVCLVPEKREELTTEGGLNVAGQFDQVKEACIRLGMAGSEVSLFIDPDFAQINAAVACGAPVIELHTGAYADATGEQQLAELERLKNAATYAHERGLVVNAGHGLNYHNVELIAEIPEINELNIGHGIVAHAVFVGLKNAVAEMKTLIEQARARVMTEEL